MTDEEIAKEAAIRIARSPSLYGVEQIVLDVIKRAKSEDKSLLQWIRQNCKVIYWSSPEAYPIEHSLNCNKDMWREIDAARKQV
jgi:hypothetical protein